MSAAGGLEKYFTTEDTEESQRGIFDLLKRRLCGLCLGGASLRDLCGKEQNFPGSGNFECYRTQEGSSS
jgi:hypothetical protein